MSVDEKKWLVMHMHVQLADIIVLGVIGVGLLLCPTSFAEQRKGVCSVGYL